MLAKKGTFLQKKDTNNFIIPYLILFVLHQNKALHSFHKRGQRPIARCMKGLD